MKKQHIIPVMALTAAFLTVAGPAMAETLPPTDDVAAPEVTSQDDGPDCFAVLRLPNDGTQTWQDCQTWFIETAETEADQQEADDLIERGTLPATCEWPFWTDEDGTCLPPDGSGDEKDPEPVIEDPIEEPATPVAPPKQEQKEEEHGEVSPEPVTCVDPFSDYDNDALTDAQKGCLPTVRSDGWMLTDDYTYVAPSFYFACATPVDYGTVDDLVWEWLLNHGWVGDPTDGAERLYCPGTVIPDLPEPVIPAALTVDEPTTDEPAPATPVASIHRDTLPETGIDSSVLWGAGALALLGTGGYLVRVSRKW